VYLFTEEEVRWALHVLHTLKRKIGYVWNSYKFFMKCTLQKHKFMCATEKYRNMTGESVRDLNLFLFLVFGPYKEAEGVET